MTLYQYKQLSEVQQAHVLWEHGVHIGERRNAEHRILLYQIEGFYVEVFYHPRQNRIERLRSFRSVGQLSPYLDEIQIGGLFK